MTRWCVRLAFLGPRRASLCCSKDILFSKHNLVTEEALNTWSYHLSMMILNKARQMMMHGRGQKRLAQSIVDGDEERSDGSFARTIYVPSDQFSQQTTHSQASPAPCAQDSLRRDAENCTQLGDEESKSVSRAKVQHCQPTRLQLVLGHFRRGSKENSRVHVQELRHKSKRYRQKMAKRKGYLEHLLESTTHEQFMERMSPMKETVNRLIHRATARSAARKFQSESSSKNTPLVSQDDSGDSRGRLNAGCVSTSAEREQASCYDHTESTTQSVASSSVGLCSFEDSLTVSTPDIATDIDVVHSIVCGFPDDRDSKENSDEEASAELFVNNHVYLHHSTLLADHQAPCLKSNPETKPSEFTDSAHSEMHRKSPQIEREENTRRPASWSDDRGYRSCDEVYISSEGVEASWLPRKQPRFVGILSTVTGLGRPSINGMAVVHDFVPTNEADGVDGLKETGDAKRRYVFPDETNKCRSILYQDSERTSRSVGQGEKGYAKINTTTPKVLHPLGILRKNDFAQPSIDSADVAHVFDNLDGSDYIRDYRHVHWSDVEEDESFPLQSIEVKTTQPENFGSKNRPGRSENLGGKTPAAMENCNESMNEPGQNEPGQNEHGVCGQPPTTPNDKRLYLKVRQKRNKIGQVSIEKTSGEKSLELNMISEGHHKVSAIHLPFFSKEASWCVGSVDDTTSTSGSSGSFSSELPGDNEATLPRLEIGRMLGFL